MSDIMKRLWEMYCEYEYYARTVQEAADEIERLRAALREIAKTTYGWEPGVWTEEEGMRYFAALFFDAQKTARAALKTPTEAAQPRMERSDND